MVKVWRHQGGTESAIWQLRIRHSVQSAQEKILKEETEGKCQLCKEYDETTDHLTSGCDSLAKDGYMIRHNKVCIHMCYLICNKLWVETAEIWCTHIAKAVCEHYYGIKWYKQIGSGQ